MLERFINEGLRGKSKTTVRTYNHALQQFQDWLVGVDADLDTFGRVDVQQYIDYMASKKKSAATINIVFSAIKKFAKWANRPETVVNPLFPEKMLIWTRTTANFMCKQRVLLPPRK